MEKCLICHTREVEFDGLCGLCEKMLGDAVVELKEELAGYLAEG